MATSLMTNTSFTADSPYFHSYVESSQSQLSKLSTSMSSIAASARFFNEAGRAMSLATHSLATSCRVSDEESTFGTELTTILHTLASVLDEVAESQSSLCDSLTISLAVSLEQFAKTENREADRLVKKAEEDTQEYDIALGRYLHGNLGEAEPPPNISSLSSGFRNLLNKKATPPEDKDKVGTASTKCSLENLRLLQVTSELARFRYLRRMQSLQERRTFELGETMLASLHGIRAYFHHASDLCGGLNPRLAKLQERQTTARTNFEEQQEPWNKREVGLKGKIGEITAANELSAKVFEAVRSGGMDMIGETVISEGDKKALLAVEEEVGVWKLQSSLSSSSLYERTPTKGVIYEGWLYKKSSSRMHLHTWNKRWFVLDKEGLNYLRGGVLKGHAHGIAMHANDELERVKVCDILLCTVRPVHPTAENKEPRFVFEIISPNNRPYTLQARGPTDYDNWTNGIRRGIEKQLIRSASAMPGAGRDTDQTESSSDESFSAHEARTLSLPPAPHLSPSISTDGAERTVMDILESAPQWNPDRTGGMSPATGSALAETMREEAASSTAYDVETGANKAHSDVLKKIMQLNDKCCECGAPSPTWISLNLGVVFCPECSGIHRSLGVHLSKVRSLMLDELSETHIELLNRLGNREMNRIWESGGQVGWVKPTSKDERSQKEAWIKSKYQFKGFIDLETPWPGRESEEEPAEAERPSMMNPPKPTSKAPPPPKELNHMKKQKSMKESREERAARAKKLFNDLVEYVKNDDVLGVAYCVAHNVSINGDGEESEEGDREEGVMLDEGQLRPLQLAVQANCPVIAEFLHLNGAK